MTLPELGFWTQVYVAAIRAGRRTSEAKSMADRAIAHTPRLDGVEPQEPKEPESDGNVLKASLWVNAYKDGSWATHRTSRDASMSALTDSGFLGTFEVPFTIKLP